MKFLISLFILLFGLQAHAEFGCTFTVHTARYRLYTERLVSNRVFQVFDWDDYEMNLHFEEGQFATFRVRSVFGEKAMVKRHYPFDGRNPFELKIMFDGMLFTVTCLHNAPGAPTLNPKKLGPPLPEDHQKMEWSDTQ